VDIADRLSTPDPKAQLSALSVRVSNVEVDKACGIVGTQEIGESA
jgi:hypothetical protein